MNTLHSGGEYSPVRRAKRGNVGQIGPARHVLGSLAMSRTLTILSAVALLFSAACNRSDAHQGHDHANQEPAEHQAGEHHAQSAGADATQGIVAIDVGDKGFLPSRVELKQGQEATLRFTRTSDSTCATKVVFPELEVEKDLPLNEAVDVKVPTNERRKLAFQCGMGMYKSAVVIN